MFEILSESKDFVCIRFRTIEGFDPVLAVDITQRLLDDYGLVPVMSAGHGNYVIICRRERYELDTN